MSKKLAIGLTPLLVTVAFALVPAVSQAAPHYYKNNVLMGSEPVPTVAWGTLTLKTTLGGTGVVTCHNVIGASEENPEGGGAGAGATESFNPYGCELNECPTELGLHAAVIAEKLPWPNVLELEGTTVRQKSTGVKVNVECLSGETEVGGQKSVGGNQPKTVKGTSALHPGLLEFDEKSGELEGEGSEGKIKGKTEGKLKTLGFEEQEVINAKST